MIARSLLPRGLSARDRRALRLGALLLLPLLATRVAVMPYVSALRDTRAKVAEQRTLLARELGMLGDAARYPTALARARGELGAEAGRLFDGPDVLTAAGALASYVMRFAGESGILLQQTDVRPHVATADDTTTLQVDVRAEGDLEGLLAFLTAIENGPRLVRVDRIAVEPSERSLIATDGDVEVLQMTATISGYWRGAYARSIAIAAGDSTTGAAP